MTLRKFPMTTLNFLWDLAADPRVCRRDGAAAQRQAFGVRLPNAVQDWYWDSDWGWDAGVARR